MSRILCITQPAYLSLKNKQLVYKEPTAEKADVAELIKEQSTITIPVEDIGVVVLDNQQITITQGLISALLDNNCAVITCNNSHMPVGLMLPLEGNTLQSERFRAQIDASLPLKKQLWQQTIQAKIRNQAAVLQSLGVEARNMLVWADDVRSGDVGNLEARAATYYWRNIFHDIPNFIRGREEAPPNNLLNYGYAILRAIVARALVGSGLLPTLGIHHHNRYNAYCLADDIMEPYRPYVDRLVLEVMKEYDYSVLSIDIKKQLLQIPHLDVSVNNHISVLEVAVGHTAASLAKCYNGEIRKIIYPDMI